MKCVDFSLYGGRRIGGRQFLFQLRVNTQNLYSNCDCVSARILEFIATNRSPDIIVVRFSFMWRWMIACEPLDPTIPPLLNREWSQKHTSGYQHPHPPTPTQCDGKVFDVCMLSVIWDDVFRANKPVSCAPWPHHWLSESDWKGKMDTKENIELMVQSILR